MNLFIPVKHSYILTIVSISIFLNGILFATPSCEIVTERFSSLADGTTYDNRSTGWYLDASNIPNALYFAVKSHRFHAEELEGEGIWYSKVMNISENANCNAGVKITKEGIVDHVNITLENLILSEITTGISYISDIFYCQSMLNDFTSEYTVDTIKTSKIYTITVKGSDNGYAPVSNVTVEEGRVLSRVNVTINERLTCTIALVIISGNSLASGETDVTYKWRRVDGFNSTKQNPTRFERKYTVTIANPVNNSAFIELVSAIKKDYQIIILNENNNEQK